MKPADVLEQLFDRKILLVIKFFVDNPEKECGVREVSKASRVPLATAFRILKRLADLQVLKFQKIKTLKLYSLNDSEAANFVVEMFAVKKSALDDFVKKASVLDGVQQIILYGKEEKNKANVLIVGNLVNSEHIRILVGEIANSYGFNILQLTLEPYQFEQMVSMGLYPGKKVVLFAK